MANYTSSATVVVEINGRQAKDMLKQLENSAAHLQKEIERVSATGDKAGTEKLRKELKLVNRDIDTLRKGAQSVEEVLSSLDKASPKELRRALRALKVELNGIERGSEAWNAHIDQIRRVRAELDSVNDSMKNHRSAWERITDSAKNFAGSFLGAAAGITGVTAIANNSVRAYAEMEQEMANVRKYTGMTAEDVKSLNEELKKIDTRTSREDLNRLAQEAGRLGKTSQEDVLGFVRAADKINVALDDLGEGATLTLSKLTGIFGDEERLGTEKALLSVGSVINELSQNCSASAPYLAEFASRMGGVGSQANMTVQQIMGFGAVLDSNNQAVEAASTALSQVIVRMYQDPAKYAKAAGLEVEEFSRLVKTDMNGALIQLLSTLNSAGGMDVLSPMFKDMGENGSRAVAALSALSKHIDEVKEQQAAANIAFEEANSIDKEFAVQNGTVAAEMDKAKKKMHEMAVELGEKLQPLMKHIHSALSALLGVISSVVTFMFNHKGAVIAVAAAYTAYSTATHAATIKSKALIIVENAKKIAMTAATAATKLGAAALNLFSGKIGAAKSALTDFFNIIKLNPVAGLTATIVGVFSLWATSTKKVTTESERLAKAQQKIKDAEQAAEAEAAIEIKTLESLYDATQNQSLAMEQRLAAAQKLQDIYPDIFKNLSQEAILAGEAAEAYDNLKKSIIETAHAEARKELLADTLKKLEKLKQDHRIEVDEILKDVDVDWRAGSYEGEHGAKVGTMYSPNHPEYMVTRRAYEAANEDYEEQKAQLESEIKLLGEQVSADIVTALSNNNVNSEDGSRDGSNVNMVTANGKFAEEDNWKALQEVLAMIAKQQGSKADGAGNIVDYSSNDYLKDMNQIQVDYYTKILERADVTGTERLQMQAKLNEALMKQQRDFNARSVEEENETNAQNVRDIKQSYIDNLINAEEMNRQLEEEELRHLEALRDVWQKIVDEKKDNVDIEEAQQNLNKADSNLVQAKTSRKSRRESEEKRKSDSDNRAKEQMRSEYFGDNAATLKAKFDAEIALLDQVKEAEIAAAGESAEERKRIEEAYQIARLAIAKKYQQEEGEESKNIFSKANEWLQSDGGKALTGTISTLSSGMSNIFSQVSAGIQADLEKQTAAIEKRYDAEISNAEGNSYKVKKLEEKKQKEIAKAKSEASRKEYAMQVIQAVAQTAQNALAAYGSAAAIPVVGHVMAPIAAAMAVAAGMLQVQALKKQQQAAESQGYSEGGFTRPGRVDEPAGIVHAGEWVASQKLVNNPKTRPLLEALDYAQRTNTIGSITNADVSRRITAPMSIATRAETKVIVEKETTPVVVEQNGEYAAVMQRLVQRLEEPFVTVNTVNGEYGIKQAQEKYDRLMSNKSRKR